MKQPIITLFFATLAFFTVATSVRAADTPRAAPNCDLSSFTDTQRIDLKQFKGKVIYVDFWASWCGPCAKSFPFMNDLQRDLKDRGLQVIGVNLDEKADDARQFLEKYHASFTIASDTDETCARNFAVKGMPSSYLVDRNGVIRHEHLGFRSGEAEEFRTLVEQLLAEAW